MNSGTGNKESKQSLPHVRRLKNIRRQSDAKERILRREDIVLESVLGLTVHNSSCLDTSKTGLLAYPAGCVVVLLNLETGDQRHIVNDDRKTVTCLSWSHDAQHLVTGESGHRPCVKVWSVATLSLVSTLAGHKFGLSCVRFTPDGQHVVSVGAEHDMTINVWDWRQATKIASNKISFNVRSISIGANGGCFVAAGNRHLKYWYVDKKQRTVSGTVPLLGRSAILGDKRNNNFLAVSFGVGDMSETIFAITKTGLLCQLNSQRLLEKWVELKVKSSSCLCVGRSYVLVGCSEGIIRCFSVTSLQYVCSLPRPDHPLPPDIVSMSYSELHSSLSVVYSDHSLYVWNVANINKVSLSTHYNYHSSCVWGVDTYRGGLDSGSSLVTCSNDETIRVWTLDNSPLSNSGLECHLQKVISVSTQDCDQDKRGVRCVQVSPDENFIASGDRSGNIRVHNAKNYSEQCKIEAHESEIMTLKFSQDTKYLASGSRDRLLHLFDGENNFEFLTTVEDHSSCVTSVDFIKNSQEEDVLVSSGSDRSILCRKLVKGESGISLSRCHHTVCKTVPYDMTVSGKDEILVACQDRNVRVFSSSQPQSKPRLLKGSASEDGYLFRMVLDRSKSFLATSCSDKTIGVFNFQTGEMLGTLVGHSDLVTGLVFSYDCRFLITVSGDSCIFVWRLPRKMVNKMSSKLDLTIADETPSSLEVVEEEEFGSPPKDLFNPESEQVSPSRTMYRFSVGKLPIWARKKVTDQEVHQSTNSPMINSSPRGKWASLRDTDNQNSQDDDVLKRFQEEDDEPDVGSVEKTKKLLFQKDDEEGQEEFMVNAIDAETLRKSQRELIIPPSNESSLVNDDLEDFETSCIDGEEDSCQVKVENTSCINYLQDEIVENLTKKKPSSISHAWREGLTPIQQRKNGVSLSTNISIEKLLANNQLHAMLKNDTPTRSPCVQKSAFQDDSQGESTKLPVSPSGEVKGSGVKVDSTKGQLSKVLIKEAADQVKEATNHLLVLFKRVSLDDDLDDNLRQELSNMLTDAAHVGRDCLRLVHPPAGSCVGQKRSCLEDTRSQEEIANAVMENIRSFQRTLKPI